MAGQEPAIAPSSTTTFPLRKTTSDPFGYQMEVVEKALIEVQNQPASLYINSTRGNKKKSTKQVSSEPPKAASYGAHTFHNLQTFVPGSLENQNSISHHKTPGSFSVSAPVPAQHSVNTSTLGPQANVPSVRSDFDHSGIDLYRGRHGIQPPSSSAQFVSTGTVLASPTSRNLFSNPGPTDAPNATIMSNMANNSSSTTITSNTSNDSTGAAGSGMSSSTGSAGQSFGLFDPFKPFETDKPKFNLYNTDTPIFNSTPVTTTANNGFGTSKLFGDTGSSSIWKNNSGNTTVWG